MSIQWAAEIAGGNSGAINLAYAPDTIAWSANATWIHNVATAADGAGSYAWNTTGVAPGTYYLSGYLWDATAGQPVYSELYTTPIVIVASVATTSVQPTTRYTYDANGNLISTTDPDQHTSWTQYDSLNRVVGQTTADGSGPGAAGYTTVTVYDADGNVLSVTDPDGNETSYTYDADGNVVSVIDTDDVRGGRRHGNAPG